MTKVLGNMTDCISVVTSHRNSAVLSPHCPHSLYFVSRVNQHTSAHNTKPGKDDTDFSNCSYLYSMLKGKVWG